MGKVPVVFSGWIGGDGSSSGGRCGCLCRRRVGSPAAGICSRCGFPEFLLEFVLTSLRIEGG